MGGSFVELPAPGTTLRSAIEMLAFVRSFASLRMTSCVGKPSIIPPHCFVYSDLLKVYSHLNLIAPLEKYVDYTNSSALRYQESRTG